MLFEYWSTNIFCILICQNDKFLLLDFLLSAFQKWGNWWQFLFMNLNWYQLQVVWSAQAWGFELPSYNPKSGAVTTKQPSHNSHNLAQNNTYLLQGYRSAVLLLILLDSMVIIDAKNHGQPDFSGLWVFCKFEHFFKTKINKEVCSFLWDNL